MKAHIRRASDCRWITKRSESKEIVNNGFEKVEYGCNESDSGRVAMEFRKDILEVLWYQMSFATASDVTFFPEDTEKEALGGTLWSESKLVCGIRSNVYWEDCNDIEEHLSSSESGTYSATKPLGVFSAMAYWEQAQRGWISAFWGRMRGLDEENRGWGERSSRYWFTATTFIEMEGRSHLMTNREVRKINISVDYEAMADMLWLLTPAAEAFLRHGREWGKSGRWAAFRRFCRTVSTFRKVKIYQQWSTECFCKDRVFDAWRLWQTYVGYEQRIHGFYFKQWMQERVRTFRDGLKWEKVSRFVELRLCMREQKWEWLTEFFFVFLQLVSKVAELPTWWWGSKTIHFVQI